MLIGHVSDDRYSALAGVWIEFESGDGGSWETRSRASGAVHADLPPGRYRVTLRQPGYGAKRISLTVPDDMPYAFRLLSDALLGYAWPKCVRAGEQAEFRVHAAEAYDIGLCRYGWEKELVQRIGWFDEHAPRASLQLTPDGDYTQTGVAWNTVGWANPSRSQFVTAPSRSGLYYFHARTQSGAEFGFPWVVAPDRPRSRMAVLLADLTWNAYNPFGGRSNYVNADALPPVPIVNARQDLRRYADPEWNNWRAGSYAPLSFDRPEPANHLPVASHITDTIPPAGRPIIWRPRNGGSSAGWSARASPTTSTAKRSCTGACLI
jgi:N,N-dimethylformamidase